MKGPRKKEGGKVSISWCKERAKEEEAMNGALAPGTTNAKAGCVSHGHLLQSLLSV